MPVLRMPQDNTLAETLGNLGQALSSNFDPLNRLRGYDIQQQMWLRQQQVLQTAARESGQAGGDRPVGPHRPAR